ncbi:MULTISPECIES: lipopolysaccharide biosynthesis protein [unclassified Geodermatophilus]|uniref:lipopolysaccharide biosynthesis protein n=1 Tax=unclassified Geodermatophilus TaxID=2637632 RepID=UPI003EEB27F6
MNAAARGGRHLERNALYLMAGTVLTAGVGMVFWVAAARFYETAEVGRAAAVISTAAFLGSLSHLNLGQVYARFLPAAGQQTRYLVHRGLVLIGAVGVLVGTGFVLLWPSEVLFASTAEAAFFPLAVAVLAVFTVQDFVLLGLRGASWIPMKNLAFSVVKLVLLVALAAVLPQGGLVVAWVVPAVVAVAVIQVLVHRRLLPRRMAEADEGHRLPPVRGLVGYASAEFAIGVMSQVIPMVLPLIILHELGAEQNAYFAIPWTINAALNMLAWNIATNFVVEASADEEQTQALTRRSLRLGLLVGGSGALTLLLFAPLVLWLFGGQYAAEGVDLLRLMALAEPFVIITTVYSGVLRIRRQAGRVVIVQGTIAVAIVSLTVLLIPSMGVTGAGLAYLIAEGGVGLVLLVPLIRSLRHRRPAAAPRPDAVPAVPGADR